MISEFLIREAAHCNLRIRTSADSRTFAGSSLQNFAGSWFQVFADFRFQHFAGSWFLGFANFNHPEMVRKFTRRSQIGLLFLHITGKSEKFLRLIRGPS
jgi:hypothetical protein